MLDMWLLDTNAYLHKREKGEEERFFAVLQTRTPRCMRAIVFILAILIKGLSRNGYVTRDSNHFCKFH